MNTAKPRLKSVPAASEVQVLDQSKWVSDAERLNLPTTNVHDSGAPRLDVDAVLRRTEPDHAKEK